MRRRVAVAACALGASPALAPAAAPAGEREQARSLASGLPVVVITTQRAIRDEPKVRARVRVVERTDGRANRPSQRGTAYSGFGAIEVRGHSSQRFAKKSYGLELRDRRGEGRDVALLGLPEDDDWVLSASHSDKTLLRNALAYRTARDAFGRWAPRTRHVELVVNGRYRGLYVLTQRPEVGKGRVEAGDGGWLMELTFGYQARGERAIRGPRSGRPLLFTDPDAPSRRRARTIAGQVAAFERALYGRRFRDPPRGWRAHLDESAAVDYVLQQELFRNVDGFHGSTFFHRRDGRIALGPVWDFDLAMGNANYEGARFTSGFQSTRRPWASRLYRDRAFVRAVTRRWREVRRAGLQRSLRAWIAEDAARIRRAQGRNFTRWPVLDRRIWPNPVARGSWTAEVRGLRRWLDRRVRWMDRALPSLHRR